MKGRVGVDAHPLNPRGKERTGKESGEVRKAAGPNNKAKAQTTKQSHNGEEAKSKRGTGGKACQSRREEEGDKMRRAGKKGTGEKVRK